MLAKYRNRRLSQRRVVIALIFLIITTCALALLIGNDIIQLSERSASQVEDAKTTSTTITAQDDFNNGEYREPGNSLSENEGNGGITDNNGSIDKSIDTASPLVSKTGEIILYSPKEDASVNNGYKVLGKSSLSKVSYRIIDSISGVIAQGELTVVDGNFSGVLEYNTNANEGRLDLYGTKSDGSEFSSIEVPIRFER